MKKFLIFALLSFVTLSSASAFAEESDKQITFAVQFTADNEAPRPPISMVLQEGHDFNLDTNKGSHQFKLSVVPTVKDGKVILKGTASSKAGKALDKLDSTPVDIKISNGEKQTLTYKFNGHTYTIYLQPTF